MSWTILFLASWLFGGAIWLLGLGSASPDRCRVLEIGCGDGGNLIPMAEALPENAQIRVRVAGETLEGDPVDKVVMLPVGPQADGVTRIVESAGMELVEQDGRLIVDQLTFGGAAEKQKIDFDWEIKSVQVEAERPAKQWFFIPAILLLLLIWKRQTSRAVREAVV